jgi:hypothetical protein
MFKYILAAWMAFSASAAIAEITIAPYASVSSTKTLKPTKGDKSTETETIKQRQTYGLRLGIGLFRALKFQLSGGQNKLTTTEKTLAAKDEYGEIDYEQDLEMSTEDPEKEIRITETQNLATAALIIDPRFKYLIIRGKAGVVARQRTLVKEEQDKDTVTVKPPITYKPQLGFGLGIRLGAKTFAVAEYDFYLYKFPEPEPFERSVTISFGVSI